MTEPEKALAEAPCEHRDNYGSTIVFVQKRPQDGVCLLCGEEFPAMRLAPDPGAAGEVEPPHQDTGINENEWYRQGWYDHEAALRDTAPALDVERREVPDPRPYGNDRDDPEW